MSSRYALYEINKLHDRFAPLCDVPRGVKPSYNINPAQTVVAIVNRDGVNQIEKMIWGFVPAGAKDTNSIFRYKTHNAKSEVVFDKPTWARAIREKRCLIPANGFYEWKASATGKDPYYIQVTNQPLFAFAGIYGTWTDPDGTDHGMCSIVTVASDADDDMMPSRLPVIVNPDDEADWLNPQIDSINSIYKIMRPYQASKLSIIRVNDAVNSPKSNGPELIERYIRA